MKRPKYLEKYNPETMLNEICSSNGTRITISFQMNFDNQPQMTIGANNDNIELAHYFLSKLDFMLENQTAISLISKGLYSIANDYMKKYKEDIAQMIAEEKNN